MTLLHFTSITDNPTSGICVVVPKHVLAQQRIENVGVVNLTNVIIKGANYQFKYSKEFSIKKLPEPYNKPDIVIFHGIYFYKYIEISKYCQREKIPYVIVPHGSLTKYAQSIKRYKKIPANILFFNKFVCNASAIHFLSEKEKNNSAKYSRKSFVIPNGIDLPNKIKTSFDRSNINMVYIGRLDIEIKGLDLLITAISLVAHKMRNKNCSLKIYGPDIAGSKEIMKKMITEKKVSDIVSIHDGVFGKEKEQVLLESDIFIQTSRSEGMPMGILEALSYGLPCAVSEGTGFSETITNYNAGWSESTSASGIAQMLETILIEHNSIVQKSQNALTLGKRYSWDTVVNDTLLTYNRLLNGN